MQNTLLRPPIKLPFLLEVALDTHSPWSLLQSLQNMKIMSGLFMEISKEAEMVMDQYHLVLQQL